MSGPRRVKNGALGGAITADQSRSDRRRLRLDGRCVRTDARGAQGAISADRLSDRLAARRQRGVRSRPGRTDRRARSAYLARLLRKRVQASARMLCRTRRRVARSPPGGVARRILSRSPYRDQRAASPRRRVGAPDRPFSAGGRFAWGPADDRSAQPAKLRHPIGDPSAHAARRHRNDNSIRNQIAAGETTSPRPRRSSRRRRLCCAMACWPRRRRPSKRSRSWKPG